VASIVFPTSPVDGQVYPSTPTAGEKVYSWSSTYQTWLLIGTATGVLEGTYGSAQKVGKFTVDISGKLTSAEDVDIQAATETLAGIAQIATQATVDTGTDDTGIVTPLKLHTAISSGAINSSNVQLSTAINGSTTVQQALADAIYDVASASGEVVATETATGQVDLTLRVATESVTGITEIATQAETDAGTDDFRYITPLKLATYISNAQIDATEIILSPTINGNVDVQSALQDAIYDLTSTGNTIVITSASTGLFNVEVAQATETLVGGAEIATQSEVDTGTDDTRIVTPLKLANAPVAHIVSAPSASSDPGSLGQVAFGGGNFYYHDGSQWWQVTGVGF